MSALAVRKLDKSFGGLRVTAGVDLVVEPGERRLIMAQRRRQDDAIQPHHGERPPTAARRPLRSGHHAGGEPARFHLGMARTYQIITLFRARRLRNVTLALLGRSPCAGTRSPARAPAHAAGSSSRDIGRWGWRLLAERPLRETSYGERRRVEIAMAGPEPRLLLLDEPSRACRSRSDATCWRWSPHPARRDDRDDRARHGRSARLRRAHHVRTRRGRRGGHAAGSGGPPAHAGDLPWRGRAGPERRRCFYGDSHVLTTCRCGWARDGCRLLGRNGAARARPCT